MHRKVFPQLPKPKGSAQICCSRRGKEGFSFSSFIFQEERSRLRKVQSCPCSSRGESCCSSRATATGTVRGWLVSGSGDPGVFLAHGGVRGCWAFCWAPLVCSGFLLYWRDTIAFLCPPLWLPAAPLLVGISLLWLCCTHGITFLWWARNPCLAPARPGRFLQKFHPPVRWPSFVGLHLGTAATGAGDRRVLVLGAAGQNGGRGLHAME